ncbi:MAG: hypothetical protein Q7Q71_07475 [Verrucomicrobiota bacterium JB023]|nr:hypothetical protein [Verrucomicrobiota bacterium JB023]
MKTKNTVTLSALVAPFFLWSCDVDKVEEGNMPDVDVNAEEGKMPEVEVTEEGKLPSVDVDVDGEMEVPKYDVDTPDIDVGTKTKEIEVPTIDVDMPDEDKEGNGDESEADLEN